LPFDALPDWTNTKMRLAFLIAVAVAVLALIGGFFYVGMHPPAPKTHRVDRTLDNDQFQTH
jgi:hypothetical protein